MPALNFQKQFAPLVESGEKRQTIRAYRKDGRDPKVGDKLYLFTGLRTKASRRLALNCHVRNVIVRSLQGLPMGHVVTCLATSSITLSRAGTIRGKEIVSVSGCPSTMEDLARDDGFESVAAMFDFFEKTHGLPFEGLLIRW